MAKWIVICIFNHSETHTLRYFFTRNYSQFAYVHKFCVYAAKQWCLIVNIQKCNAEINKEWEKCIKGPWVKFSRSLSGKDWSTETCTCPLARLHGEFSWEEGRKVNIERASNMPRYDSIMWDIESEISFISNSMSARKKSIRNGGDFW
jgi:hypothetical protein